MIFKFRVWYSRKTCLLQAKFLDTFDGYTACGRVHQKMVKISCRRARYMYPARYDNDPGKPARHNRLGGVDCCKHLYCELQDKIRQISQQIINATGRRMICLCHWTHYATGISSICHGIGWNSSIWFHELCRHRQADLKMSWRHHDIMDSYLFTTFGISLQLDIFNETITALQIPFGYVTAALIPGQFSHRAWQPADVLWRWADKWLLPVSYHIQGTV